MSPVYATRRRAEEFNALVEGPTRASDPRFADALDVVGQLREVVPVQPRAEFSAALRAELMAAADTLLLPSADTQRLTLPSRRTARDRRIAALVGACAVVGASTSLAVAAQSALPGEMLYPLKRVLENAEAGAQLSDEARATTLLDSATDRLAEVSALLRTGDLREGPVVADTLVDFSDQSLEASELLLADYAETGDEASVEELLTFTSSSMETLAQLETMLPEEALDELQYAAEVLTEIDAAAAAVCPSCEGGITQVPPSLLAGRLPEPQVVTIVPAPVVSTEGPRSGGDKGDGKDNRDDGAGGSGGGTGDGGGLLPDAPDIGSGNGGTTGGTGDDTDGPIEDITDAVTGGSTTSGDGVTGIDPLDEVIEDVDDGLGEVGDDLSDLP
jgi:hypothetical protein